MDNIGVITNPDMPIFQSIYMLRILLSGGQFPAPLHDRPEHR